MAQLVVRNLEDSVKRRIKRRAARNGRSMEEEVREILRSAANEKSKGMVGLGTAISSLFKGTGLKFDIPELRGFAIEPVNFDE